MSASLLGVVIAGLFISLICIAIVSSFVFAFGFALVELKMRWQNLRRFAPTREGYYEALLTRDGFIKPDDNIPLQLPYTYSPHITYAKEEKEEPRADDNTIRELYDLGMAKVDISKQTGKSYYQIQKALGKKKN